MHRDNPTSFVTGFNARNRATHETFTLPESLFGALVPDRDFKGVEG